jgi:hypothetical protein
MIYGNRVKIWAVLFITDRLMQEMQELHLKNKQIKMKTCDSGMWQQSWGSWR